MFDLVHAMRTRIVTSPAFTGDRILGAILFEQTMDREVEGRGTADYLWSVKQVVPFLKVDKGLADEANGVQMMKAMPDLDALLARAKAKGVFGTKMRSVIKHADAKGIEDVVAQQFTVGKQILAAGLMPIIEPEVDIHATDKEGAERLLKAAIVKQLDALGPQQQVMLKLTIPVRRRFLRGPGQASEGAARRRAVGRLLARRGEHAACPQPRRDRELFARADRGTHRAAERRRSSTRRWTRRSPASTRPLEDKDNSILFAQNSACTFRALCTLRAL